MSDFGLAAFKASELGQAIAPIIFANRDVMRTYALRGEAPVKALDDALAHLVSAGLHTQENNKHVGRWVYEVIGEAEFETAGRELFNGATFESGAVFRQRNEPIIRRKAPRGGIDERPVPTKLGFYQLVRPGLPSDLRTQSDYAVYVRRLSEAVPLIEMGYHIRMGRRGVRPSLIAKESLVIQNTVSNCLRDQERQVYLTSELPADLAGAILEDLDNLQTPSEAIENGDAIIG
jgi:hypothetical protein